jgi:hypothetical protein
MIKLGENLSVTAAFLQEMDPLLVAFYSKDNASASRKMMLYILEAVPTPPGLLAACWNNTGNARAPIEARPSSMDTACRHHDAKSVQVKVISTGQVVRIFKTSV